MVRLLLHGGVATENTDCLVATTVVGASLACPDRNTAIVGDRVGVFFEKDVGSLLHNRLGVELKILTLPNLVCSGNL